MNKKALSKVAIGLLSLLSSMGIYFVWLVSAASKVDDVLTIWKWLFHPAFFLSLFALGIGFSALAFLTSEPGIHFRRRVRSWPLRSPIVLHWPWPSRPKVDLATPEQVQCLEGLRELSPLLFSHFFGLQQLFLCDILPHLKAESRPLEQAVATLVNTHLLAPYVEALNAWRRSHESLRPCPSAEEFAHHLEVFLTVFPVYDQLVNWGYSCVKFSSSGEEFLQSDDYAKLRADQSTVFRKLRTLFERSDLRPFRGHLPRNPWPEPSGPGRRDGLKSEAPPRPPPDPPASKA